MEREAGFEPAFYPVRNRGPVRAGPLPRPVFGVLAEPGGRLFSILPAGPLAHLSPGRACAAAGGAHGRPLSLWESSAGCSQAHRFQKRDGKRSLIET